MKKKKSDSSSSSLSRGEELEARVKELEKALAYANLRAHALDRMIDIAEEQQGVCIRKKAWYQTVMHLRKEFKASLCTLCGLFGKSRQTCYRYKPDHFSGSELESLLLRTILTYRSQAPRIGAFKLYLICCSIFGWEYLMGRDAFFGFLRRKGLMLKPSKGKRTTYSNHMFRTHKNLIIGFTPPRPPANSRYVISPISAPSRDFAISI